MTETGVLITQDQFSCPTCSDLLKVPVTIPCGHSFCMGCIAGHWDEEEPKKAYSCPQCRQTFTPRPVLGKNTMLAEVVEKLKSEALGSAPDASHAYAVPGDVECGSCSGRKRKAVKFCLSCMSSYCATHVRGHDSFFQSKKHKAVDAACEEQLVCSRHERPLEVFCRTDETCICTLCTVYEHSGHDTVSDAEERMEKEKELGETWEKLQELIEEKDTFLQDIKQDVNTLKCSADAAVETCERVFMDMIRFMEEKRSEVKKLVRDQESAEVGPAEEVMKTVEEEIGELKSRAAELDMLSQSDNNIHFLKSFPSLCVYTVKSTTCSLQTEFFQRVSDCLGMLSVKLQDVLQQGLQDMTATEGQSIADEDSTTSQHSSRASPGATPGPQNSEHDLLVEVEELPVYTIREVLNSRRFQGRLQYLVNWEGYEPDNQSWVNRSDIFDPSLLDEFHRSNPSRPGLRRRGRPYRRAASSPMVPSLPQLPGNSPQLTDQEPTSSC